jgi:Rieske 2Fe-2S family protein
MADQMTRPMAAPLSARSVASLLGNDDLAAARTLPAEAYLSPEVLEWERRNVFDANWVAVGRSDLLPEPGSQRAIRVGEFGVLLVRDDEGQVAAFHNTCRHRGHELLQEGECRRKRAIACPYHAWVYGLDGNLVRASRFTDSDDFDLADYPLIPLGAEEFAGWIFVAVDAPQRSFADTVGNIGEFLEDWEPERMALGAKRTYNVESNWKLIVENYFECYHCPAIHPELCAVSDPEAVGEDFPHRGGMWLGAPLDLREGMETQSLDGKSGGSPFRRLSPEQLRQSRYFLLAPNMLISPHPDYFMTHRLQPVSPTKTVVECEWFFPPEVLESPDFDPSFAVDFWDRTNEQDLGATESVTRAMHSPGHRPGPFNYRETHVHAFQLMMARAYADGVLPEPEVFELTPA